VDAKDNILSRFQKIHALINNALIIQNGRWGLSDWTRLENLPEKIWNDDISVGLPGFFCSRIFGTSMAANGGGVIINIASDLGIIAPDQRIYKRKASSLNINR